MSQANQNPSTTTNGTASANGGAGGSGVAASATRRSRNARRQSSTRTVPEYSEQPNDEELVLVKARTAPMSEHPEEEDTVALLSASGPDYSRSSMDISSAEGFSDESGMPMVMPRAPSPPPYVGARRRAGTESNIVPLRSNSGFEDIELGVADGSGTGTAGRTGTGTGTAAGRQRGHTVARSLGSLDIIPRLTTDASQASRNSTLSSSSRVHLANLRNALHLRGASSSSILPFHHSRGASSSSRISTNDISAPLGDTLVRSAYI
jgi:hypothetical protein